MFKHRQQVNPSERTATFDGIFQGRMLDSPPNNLDTSSRGPLLYHGKELYDLGQSHRVFLALAKVSTITAADNITQSSSSDDESSNCL
jgi:hypothetical protein